MGNIEFLLSNAACFIKFRVKKEFLNVYDANLYEQIKTTSVYLKRLNSLRSKEKDHDFFGVHGATNEHLENAIQNLLFIGIDIQDSDVKEALDARIKIIRDRTINENYCFDKFAEIILFPLLYKIGYREEWLITNLNNRLDLIYQFCKENNYNIYLDKTNLVNIPKCWKEDKVISPQYYYKGEFQFPLIYDIVYLHEIYKEVNTETKHKIDTIIEYIISQEYYSKIQTTYGILLRNLDEEKPTRYMRMGWDCKIHGFFDFNGNEFDKRRLLDRLELFSVFESFKNNNNFTEWLDYFDKHKTEYGTYILPNELFNRENKFGESRRIKNYLEIESTFIVENIKRFI